METLGNPVVRANSQDIEIDIRRLLDRSVGNGFPVGLIANDRL